MTTLGHNNLHFFEVFFKYWRHQRPRKYIPILDLGNPHAVSKKCYSQILIICWWNNSLSTLRMKTTNERLDVEDAASTGNQGPALLPDNQASVLAIHPWSRPYAKAPFIPIVTGIARLTWQGSPKHPWWWSLTKKYCISSAFLYLHYSREKNLL